MQFEKIFVAKFQDQDCQLTLAEAIEEFYRVNADKFSKPEPKTPWTNLLVTHDVGHVFFGVNTSVIEEATGDFWTLFATDITFWGYIKYAATPEAKQLFKDMGVLVLLKTLIYSIPIFFKVLIRSKRMTKIWNHKNYQQYLDRTLSDLRQEYNLKIL